MKELGYYDESFNSSLQASRWDLSSYRFIWPIRGTDAMEREKASVRLAGGAYLWHVNQALRRLFSGAGEIRKCEQCGEEIGFERLDALPHARLCIKCKAKEEMETPLTAGCRTTAGGGGRGRSGHQAPGRIPAGGDICRSGSSATSCSCAWSTTSAAPSGCVWAERPTRAISRARHRRAVRAAARW